MKSKCLVVDDEPIAQSILKRYIKELPNLELIEVCDNAIDALSVLKINKIDIIFSDIEMPKINGIDFLKTLENPPAIIFTTAYRDFALDSYELNAVDYLLKPFSFERFLKAVNKVKSKIIEEDIKEFEYYKVDRKNVKVYYKDILYIEGLSNYVVFHTIKKQLIVYHKLMDLEKSLPKGKFVRIHKSYIVSLDHIKAYGPDHVEVENKQLTVGNKYKNSFFNSIH